MKANTEEFSMQTGRDGHGSGTRWLQVEGLIPSVVIDTFEAVDSEEKGLSESRRSTVITSQQYTWIMFPKLGITTDEELWYYGAQIFEDAGYRVKSALDPLPGWATPEDVDLAIKQHEIALRALQKRRGF